MSLGTAANRIFRVLDTGPRKASVLRALVANDEKFERAIGQLFLIGVVRWYGRGRGRTLGRMSK